MAKTAVDIGFVVDDIEAMVRFYGEGLGLPKVFEETPPADTPYAGRTQHGFQAGSTRLKLWVFHDGAPAKGPDDRLAQVGIRYMAIYVDDMQEIVARLASMGFDVSTPPFRSRLGAAMTIAFVRDPDGNYIELIQADAPNGHVPRNFRGVAAEFADHS